MILGSITATCLTYLDCMESDYVTTDVWVVENMRYKRHLQQDLNYTIRYVQNVIKYTSIKLYNPDIYNQSMFIERVTNFPYENSNTLRLVFSRCAPAQQHLTSDKGASYRPISLLSVIAKTYEKSLLPYITENTPMQHGYRTHHSTVTPLDTLNNTTIKKFNEMVPPTQTISVELDISKYFSQLIEFTQREFKTGVPQSGVISPALFSIYTSDIPPPRAPVQVMVYTDDITITSTHTHECSHEIHTTIHTYRFCLGKTK